ncbi:Hsp20 family protein [Luteibacter sp. UNCMF366Tsu5.1]|uniref:Hsp20 family protein n=1 Tax=Luteibacter sp. UNCMF366Tsu5.1 TaxID=1502758 RepID=UPI000908B380|nr:Hsp20 family protein [Luteibacter sp. UNCMF366Tsu5.1]SFW29894.1 molecular chaperone IbpA [Luteibacter sp. UNCMF366Tsu5.1]
MRTLLDFAPLHRSSVGFDRVFDLLEAASRNQASDNYPPFDSIKLDEDRYRVTMAVAGFRESDLNITTQGNLLLVSGERKGEPEGEYLHRGIATRSFQRRFELAEHVHVTGARLADGLLSIDLRREVPDAMRPRQIPIGSADTLEHNGSVRQITDQQAAA